MILLYFWKKVVLKYTIFSNLYTKKDPPSYFKTYNAHLHSATYKLFVCTACQNEPQIVHVMENLKN